MINEMIQPTVTIEPSPAAYDNLIVHLTREVERLVQDRDKALLQVKAEQEHNRRLLAACAFYRGAAAEGLGLLRQAAETGEIDANAASVCTESIAGDLEKGDEVILPTAK
jgi:hypothetical protein